MPEREIRSSPILDLIVGMLLRALRPLPWRVVLRTGEGLGRLAGRVALRKRRRTFENLALAGVKDPRTACSEAWGRAGETLAEMLWSASRSPEELRDRITVEGLETLRKAAASGRGVLLVSAHLGNWEAVALAATFSELPVAVVARPLRTRRLERRIVEFRERGRVRTLLRGRPGASLAAARWLLKGGVLGCMMDRASGGERVTVPFLGRATRIPLGPVTLALRSGSSVVVGGARRRRDGRTLVSFRQVATGGARDPLELARIIGRALEEEVRPHPEQWFWIYRRQPPAEGASPAVVIDAGEVPGPSIASV